MKRIAAPYGWGPGYELPDGAPRLSTDLLPLAETSALRSEGRFTARHRMMRGRRCLRLWNPRPSAETAYVIQDAPMDSVDEVIGGWPRRRRSSGWWNTRAGGWRDTPRQASSWSPAACTRCHCSLLGKRASRLRASGARHGHLRRVCIQPFQRIRRWSLMSSTPVSADRSADALAA
jgi:hypothetical protein